MMTHDSHDPTGCPGYDDLSAWHDSAAPDTEIDTHVRTCQACQNILHEMEVIDMQVQQHLEEILPDARTMEHLILNTRKHIQPRAIPVLSFRNLLRIAAAVAALLVVVAIQRQLQTSAESPVQRAESPVEVDAQFVTDIPVDETSYRLSPLNQKLIDDLVREFGPMMASSSPRPAPAASMPVSIGASAKPYEVASLPTVGSAVDSLVGPSRRPVESPIGSSSQLDFTSDINLVWYGTPPSFQEADTERISLVNTRKTVRDRVRHVWLVPETAAPLRELQQLLPRHKQDFQDLINQDRDEYVLQLVISDKDLQELVDHFDSLDFKLISPTAPQPGDGANLRLTGKGVQYEIDFVRN